MIVVALLGVAHAQGYSTDVEFVRPSFGGGSFTAVEVPEATEPGTLRAGLVAQYLRVPVTMHDPDDDVVGALIKNRAFFHLGGSVDVSEVFTFHAVVPAAFDWDSDLTDGSLNGFGIGDVTVGGRAHPLAVGSRVRFQGGVRAGLFLPTGRREVFLAEEGVRASTGLIASLDIGILRLATDIGIMARTAVETGRDFDHASELVWGNGVRVALPDATRTALTAQILSRNGFRNFFGKGAENAAEGLAGVQVQAARELAVDVGGGRGFTDGVGTTNYRLYTQLTFLYARKEREVAVVVPDAPPPPPPPPPLPEEILPEPEWEEGELAKVTDDLEHIVIRDMLEFQVGTTVLLDRSRPTLLAVGRILHENASIGHVVIEGHASEEGGYEANFELSLGRALTVFRELLRVGVHPDRLSFRGMGEVEPLVGAREGLDPAANEALLQRNRRVEFHITQHFADPVLIPDYRLQGHREPWSGQPYEVRAPILKLPDTPPPEEPPAFEVPADEEIEFVEE